MSLTSCFWALLSLENFKFLYLPKSISEIEVTVGITVGDLLLSHSLLEFIHPDELSLATTDLLNFIRIKSLAGAITRCRLCSINSMLQRDSPTDWIINDVVMYTATSETILTFFHTNHFTNSQLHTFCGNIQFYDTEIANIFKILQKYSLSTTISIDDPIRLFQIYHTTNKKLLISWPSDSRHHPAFFKNILKHTSHLTCQELDKNNLQPSVQNCCTHHSHSITSGLLIEPYVCRVEKIIIIYGQLIFSSFQIVPSNSYKSNINHILNTDLVSPKPIKWTSKFGIHEKKCENCQTNKSPEWRKGPSGYKTLCNACGLRYARLVAKNERQQPKETDSPVNK